MGYSSIYLTIIDEQKWLDQEGLMAHTNRVREMIKAMFTEVCYFWDRKKQRIRIWCH